MRDQFTDMSRSGMAAAALVMPACLISLMCVISLQTCHTHCAWRCSACLISLIFVNIFFQICHALCCAVLVMPACLTSLMCVRDRYVTLDMSRTLL